MATTKVPKGGGVLDPQVLNPEHEVALLDVRKTFLFQQLTNLDVPTNVAPIVQRRGITFWEQLNCVGFNPQLSLLEATISVKRTTGYSGGLCSAGSTE